MQEERYDDAKRHKLHIERLLSSAFNPNQAQMEESGGYHGAMYNAGYGDHRGRAMRNKDYYYEDHKVPESSFMRGGASLNQH